MWAAQVRGYQAKQGCGDNRGVKRFSIGFGITLLTLVAASTIALTIFPPVLELPKPSGAFAIGYLETTLTDATRTMRGREARVISLDVWYPADNATGLALEPYSDAALRTMMQEVQGLPAIGDDQASHSARDAPAAAGKHRVIIFNHGQGSFTKQNFSNMEELASHGYVVISIGHPEESLLARDAKGADIAFNQRDTTYLRLKVLQQNLEVTAKQLEVRYQTQRDATTLAQHRAASRKLRQQAQYALLEPQLQTWVRDTRFVLSSLRSGIGALPFALPNGIVVSGHSLGGMVAFELGRQPVAGLRSIIALDAPWIGAQPLRVPALVMASTEFNVAGADLALRGTFDLPLRNSAGAYLLEPSGAAHFNFTDLNYIPAIKLFAPVLGSIPATQMGALVNTALLEYLRRLGRDDFSKDLLPAQVGLRQAVFSSVR